MPIDAKDIFENIEKEDVWLRVQGKSMRPFLREGRDTVVFSKPERLKVGDIVVFMRNGYYIMHRIIKIENGYISTLGDNLKTPEEKIPVENVVAKAVSAVRDGKEITPNSPIWQFFGKVYIHQNVRKILNAFRR